MKPADVASLASLIGFAAALETSDAPDDVRAMARKTLDSVRGDAARTMVAEARRVVRDEQERA
jgi:hypothetical protein